MNYLKNCPNCSTTLRFPASQGTVLVRCPVCSHRFQFNSSVDSDFTKEIETGSAFHFKPSKKEYFNLIMDLLYAPIDYFKTKFKSEGSKKRESLHTWKKPKLLIELLLLFILFLYLIRALKTEEVQPSLKNSRMENETDESREKELPPPIQPDHSEPSIDI